MCVLSVDQPFHEGSVSGSCTGPGDPVSPAMLDPETFPYEWPGSTFLPCFMSVIGEQIESHTCDTTRQIVKLPIFRPVSRRHDIEPTK